MVGSVAAMLLQAAALLLSAAVAALPQTKIVFAEQESDVEAAGVECGEWELWWAGPAGLPGRCWPLLARGPCTDQEWLTTRGCRARPCPAPAAVFWPPLCECLTETGPGYSTAAVCGPASRLVWSPAGEPVCQSSQQLQSAQTAARIFDLIPGRAGPARDQAASRCAVDEAGRCRDTVQLRQRFGTWEEEVECKPPMCEGDTLAWHNGSCYQAASTGPCSPGSWLTLSSVAGDRPVLTCTARPCPAGGVWWPPSCSCQAAPCSPADQLLLSPRGSGLCSAPHDSTVPRIFDLIPSGPGRSRETPALATRQNCNLDEQGKCRQNVNLRGRINVVDNETRSSAAELISWLKQFDKTEDDIKCERAECHREGKVLFETDGQCYNLLERGPCYEAGNWLVMVLEDDR